GDEMPVVEGQRRAPRKGWAGHRPLEGQFPPVAAAIPAALLGAGGEEGGPGKKGVQRGGVGRGAEGQRGCSDRPGQVPDRRRGAGGTRSETRGAHHVSALAPVCARDAAASWA